MECEVLEEVKEFPAFMEIGSRGVAVNLILAFLVGWAAGRPWENHGVVCDAEYGERGVGLMKVFQANQHLEADGGFGPTTRAFIKQKYGFDFEAIARATGGGTVFIQPDGRRLLWELHVA